LSGWLFHLSPLSLLRETRLGVLFGQVKFAVRGCFQAGNYQCGTTKWWAKPL
jgi:hypothetical protein